MCLCLCTHVGRKKGNVLFNDALNTFYFTVIIMASDILVMDHSYSERANTMPPHGLLFPNIYLSGFNVHIQSKHICRGH